MNQESQDQNQSVQDPIHKRSKQLLHHIYSTSIHRYLHSHNIRNAIYPSSTGLSVLRTDKVGHSLGLALVVVSAVRVVVDVVLAVAVAVGVVALLGTDVFHLVDGAALGAALDGAVAGAGQPDDDVGVGWVAGAAEVLLVTEGLDGDGVVDRACEGSGVSFGLGLRRVEWAEMRGIEALLF